MRAAILSCLVVFLAASCTSEKKPPEAKPGKKGADAGPAAAKPAKVEPAKNPYAHLSPSLIGKHEGIVFHVAISPDGKDLLSCGSDKLIRLWSLSTGEQIRTFAGHTDKVLMADFSPDGRLIVSASADKTARVWDVASGKVRKVLEDKLPKPKTDEEATELAKMPPMLMNWAVFTPDGKQVLTASDDFALKLWDVSSGKKLNTFQDGEGCRQNRVYRRRDAAGWVSSAGCMADGVSYIKFWDDAGNQVSVAGDENHDAHYLAFDRGGRFIIGADGSLNFTVFSAQGSLLKQVLVGGYHFSLAFGPGDKTLLVGTDRGEILVFRPGNWERLGKIDLPDKDGIDDMVLHPGDNSLIVAMRNGKILRFTTPIE